MMRITIAVQPRGYEALIENGLLCHAGALLREIFPDRKRCFVVTVPVVRRRWGLALQASLAQRRWETTFVVMRQGERHKSLATLQALAGKLAEAGADRDAVLLAFGGGVVGDVAGFLASVYMRGLDIVHIPTTVVAQLDASIGGKTGVNLRAGKNLIGTFHQPRLVLIDPQMLSTLPEREFRSGLYEALKCGVIGSPELFSHIENRRERILARESAELEYVIGESVKLKAAVVSADERETGLRRILNFGHTIGHALESRTDYRYFLHGEAVAWGMVAAATIAATIKKTDRGTAERIGRATLALGALPCVRVNARHVLHSLQSDKKTKDGIVHFVLPRQIGKVEVVNDVPKAVVLDAIEQLRVFSR
ncbi:MAG: 3-dehydroquinate synthase [Acidobacteria bacterium]|nr:3-dehydroquinate synthase [Acidobacteriota bacterium]